MEQECNSQRYCQYSVFPGSLQNFNPGADWFYAETLKGKIFQMAPNIKNHPDGTNYYQPNLDTISELLSQMLFCLEEALFEFRDSELFGQIFWAAFQQTLEQTLLTSGVWQTNALNTSP